MTVIDVVSDASVALKWFHADGEQEAEDARALLSAHKERRVALAVLDLTHYEIGNALLRGRAGANADQVATVLESLAEICPAVELDPEDFRLTAELAERHDLTIYDAAYAAVAKSREATLATSDDDLVKVGLGTPPGELAAKLTDPEERNPQRGSLP